MNIVIKNSLSVAALLLSSYLLAQEQVSNPTNELPKNNRVEMIYAEDINYERELADAIQCADKRDKDNKIKLSAQLIEHYKQATDILRKTIVDCEDCIDSIESIKEQLQQLQFLTSTDVDVFEDSIFAIIDAGKVPPSLKSHYENVAKAIELRKQIDDIDNEINTLKQLGYDVEKISSNIINKVDFFFNAHLTFVSKEENMSTFSDAQRRYVGEGLQKKYNVIIDTYFQDIPQN